MMVLLGIHLQRGFAGDCVRVRVNGKEVFTSERVTSSRLRGYAQIFSVEIPTGQSMVEVELPNQNLRETISLPVKAPIHLGVSIEKNQIRFHPQEKAFMYM